jgi:hypothetical protein
VKRMNRKARRYLLTFAPEPFAWSFGHTGGRWAVQVQPDHLHARDTVFHFASPAERAEWIGRNPQRRKAIGKRDMRVKAFRRKAIGA